MQLSLIHISYETAREAHKDQKRKSGEPYIIHPLCVAIILADLELDKETIVAGLLHDAVEDTWMTCDEITRESVSYTHLYPNPCRTSHYADPQGYRRKSPELQP